MYVRLSDFESLQTLRPQQNKSQISLIRSYRYRGMRGRVRTFNNMPFLLRDGLYSLLQAHMCVHYIVHHRRDFADKYKKAINIPAFALPNGGNS